MRTAEPLRVSPLWPLWLRALVTRLQGEKNAFNKAFKYDGTGTEWILKTQEPEPAVKGPKFKDTKSIRYIIEAGLGF